MKWIDTHAHLYVKEFEKDIDEVIERLQQEKIEKVLLPNIDKGSIADLYRLVDKNPNLFIPMMGLHPCAVKEDYLTELNEIEAHFFRQDFKSVGEIGLDYYWDTQHKQLQIDAFITQIQWAKEKKVPIAVHCRESFNDILDTLEKQHDNQLKGVLHCFTGNIEQANRLIDMGFYLGIGGVVTYKNSGLAATLAEIDPKHLVLETDAPYLSPVPKRGKRNESAYIRYVAEKLCDVYQLPLHEIAAITTENAYRLFSL